MTYSIEGKASLAEDYNTTDDESDNESDDNIIDKRDTVDKSFESNKKSILDEYGVKSSKFEKCSKCIDGYQDNKSIYYAKDKNQNEFILMINKEGKYFSVTILNLSGIYGAKSKKIFKSLQELNKIYPILKVIPMIKKYYSIDGTPLIAGKDTIPNDGLIVKEVPDYKGVGLEEPRLVGGRKTKTRKSKNKKSRKSKNKKSRKTRK
jgi:hypothetical protein